MSYLVDGRQLRDLRTVENTQCQADHLQVLTSGGSGDVTGLSSNIVDDRLLQPGDKEMGSFVDDLLLHTRQPVEDDSAGTTTNVVNRVVEDQGARGDGESQTVDVVETVCRHG